MDEQTADALAGILTAQNFLLQNVYALLYAGKPDPARACQEAAVECIRQFGELPANNVEPPELDKAKRITDHGLVHLDRFWALVEERVQKHVDRPA